MVEELKTNSPEASNSIEDPIILKYKIWLQDSFSEHTFADRDYSFAEVREIDLFGETITPRTQGLSNAVIEAYQASIPEGEKKSFRLALSGSIEEKVNQKPENIKLNEIDQLISVAWLIKAGEAVPAVAKAVVENEAFRYYVGEPVRNRMYAHIFSVANEEGGEYRNEALEIVEELIDHEGFDNDWTFNAVTALIRKDPTQANFLLKKYGRRISSWIYQAYYHWEEDDAREVEVAIQVQHWQRMGIEITPEAIKALQMVRDPQDPQIFESHR